MTALWLAAALGLPWLTGTLFLRWAGGRGLPRSMQIGAGWLCGQAIMLAFFYAHLYWSHPARPRTVLVALAAASLILLRRRKSPVSAGNYGARTAAEDARERAGRSVILPVIVLLSLSIKAALMLGSILWSPVRGDDAVAYWLYRAKVITQLEDMPVEPAGDFYYGGSNPRYPVFASLIAAWPTMICDGWDERIAASPWLLYFVSLPLMIAGGLRRRSETGAWFAAWIVASMPLAAVHAYQPGYADWPLACFLAGGVLMLLRWRESNDRRILLVAGLLLSAAACMKREGPALAAIAVLSIFLTSYERVAKWPRMEQFRAAAAAAGVILLLTRLLDFSDLAESAAKLVFDAELFRALQRHAFEWSSFHLCFWMIAGCVAAAAVSRWARGRGPALLLTAGLTGFVVLVFLSDRQLRFALNDQTPSRLLLQIAPALVIAWVRPAAAILKFRRERS